MPGRSKRFTLLGVAFAVVGVVGYVVLGWRFGGESEPVALALAAVAVAVAVGSELYDRV